MRDAPSRPWKLIWIASLALFLTALVAIESIWHRLGYHSSVVDSPALWRYWYEQAADGRPKTIVLIGSSRIQSGLRTAQLRDRLPEYQVVQLGQYGGRSPVGVLRELALDGRFKGIVICDMLTPFAIRSSWEKQRTLYEYRPRPGEMLEAAFSAVMHEQLALSSPTTGVQSVLKNLVNKYQLPPLDSVRMHADRSLDIDFRPVQKSLGAFKTENVVGYRREYEESQHPSPSELRDELEEIGQFCRRIQSRGGNVVFMRMPSSGGLLALEEEYHPKSDYWDTFAAASPGEWIHFTDLGVDWMCPDDSHLDYRDSIKFTNAFVDELMRRGILHAR